MAGVEDHETVSIYPLDDQQLEDLLTKVGECTFNWGTKDGWPVGVIMSFLWKNGRFWITAGAHRHRISAVRRDPRVSVVVSGAAAAPARARPSALPLPRAAASSTRTARPRTGSTPSSRPS